MDAVYLATTPSQVPPSGVEPNFENPENYVFFDTGDSRHSAGGQYVFYGAQSLVTCVHPENKGVGRL